MADGQKYPSPGKLDAVVLDVGSSARVKEAHTLVRSDMLPHLLAAPPSCRAFGVPGLLAQALPKLITMSTSGSANLLQGSTGAPCRSRPLA